MPVVLVGDGSLIRILFPFGWTTNHSQLAPPLPFSHTSRNG